MAIGEAHPSLTRCFSVALNLLAAFAISACVASTTVQSAPESDSVTIIDLPDEESLPGYFYKFDFSLLYNVSCPPFFSSEALPRQRVSLASSERLLWRPKSGKGPNGINTNILKTLQVRGIALFGVSIDARLMLQLAEVGNIEYLCLNNCEFAQDAFTPNEQLARLLRIDMNNAKGLTPEVLLAGLLAPRVACIDIRGVNVTAEHMAALYDSSRLEALAIGPHTQQDVTVDLAKLFSGKQLRQVLCKHVELGYGALTDRLASLTDIRLDSCTGVTDGLLDDLLKAPLLSSLSLTKLDAVSKGLAQSILKKHTLREVHIDSCAAFEPDRLLSGVHNTSIESLSLRNYDLKSWVYRKADEQRSPVLRSLSVIGCELGDSAWSFVGTCTGLKELDISQTMLTASAVIAIEKLSQLEAITLEHTIATEKQLVSIASIPSLRRMRFEMLTSRISDDVKHRLTRVNEHLVIE